MANIITNPPGNQSIVVGDLLPASGNTSQSLGTSGAIWNGVFGSLTAASLYNGSANTVVFVSQMAGTDIGAKINAADAAIGSSNAGTIVLDVSGSMTTNVTISEFHDMLGANQTCQVVMTNGSYITLNGNNHLQNFTLVSDDTTQVNGQIRATDVDVLTLNDLIFEGGGWNILFDGCSGVIIRDCLFGNITASTAWCILLDDCSNVLMERCYASAFTNTTGAFAGIFSLVSCSYCDIIACEINGVDNSYNANGGGALSISGSNYINIIGGNYSNNPNLDGIVLQAVSGSITPTSNINIVGVHADNNGQEGGNTISMDNATVAITTDVATVTVSNAFSAGQWVTFIGLAVNTFLNGNSYQIASAGSSAFTFDISHANQSATSETAGTANASYYNNGSGLDAFQARYVRVSNCHFEGNGANGKLSGIYVWSAWEVHFSNCYIAAGGINGIEIIGAQNCSVTDCTILGNQKEGIRVGFQGFPSTSHATCNTSGTTVSSIGTNTGTGQVGGWGDEMWININGTFYVISGNDSATELTLQGSGAGTQTGVYWVVPSFVYITGCQITENGAGLGGDSYQIGLHVQDLCYCQTTNTTFNDPSTSPVQKYGVVIDSGAICNIYWPNFYPGGNQTQNILDNSGKNIICVGTTAAPTTNSYPLTSGSVGFFINQGATSQSTVLYVSQGNSISAITVP